LVIAGDPKAPGGLPILRAHNSGATTPRLARDLESRTGRKASPAARLGYRRAWYVRMSTGGITVVSTEIEDQLHAVLEEAPPLPEHDWVDPESILVDEVMLQQAVYEVA
jgi:hypothetical protein